MCLKTTNQIAYFLMLNRYYVCLCALCARVSRVELLSSTREKKKKRKNFLRREKKNRSTAKSKNNIVINCRAGPTTKDALNFSTRSIVGSTVLLQREHRNSKNRVFSGNFRGHFEK